MPIQKPHIKIVIQNKILGLMDAFLGYKQKDVKKFGM